MGLEKHARLSEDAEARIPEEDAEAWVLEEAVESSYRKGGINASSGEQEVFKFIEDSYNEDVLERIYINGEGAEWIRIGADKMSGFRIYRQNKGDMPEQV